MAQYLIIPKKLARAAPFIGRTAQRLEGWAIGFLFWLLNQLSPELATRLSGVAFRLTSGLSDKAQKADQNLAVAFPERDAQWRARTVKQIFHSLGVASAELVKLQQIWEEREQRLRFELAPGVEQAIKNGQPIVFVTAHVGAWQLTNLISLHRELSISTVYAAESNLALRDIMIRLRQSFGVKLIPSEAGARPLMKELAAGNCIGLAMDTRLKSGTLLPFFGRDALCNTTPARLALRSGAALVPIRAEREPGCRYRITAFEPLHCDNDELSADQRAEELTRQINSHFESWIQDTPGEWICLKRRWPKAHRL